MTFSPYLDAAPHIQFHIATATIALILGPYTLYMSKRGGLHKILGYIWMISLGSAALSSFLITSFGIIGPFSPIHLLSVLALWSIWRSIRAAMNGNFRVHRAILHSLYWRGLCIAGLFNFLPGRATNRVFFEEAPRLGFIVIALGGIGLLAQWYFSRPQETRSKRANKLDYVIKPTIIT